MPNPNLALPDQNMDFEQFRSFVGEQLMRINYLFKNIEGLNIKQIQFDLEGGAFIRIDRKGIKINNGEQNTFTVGIDGRVTMTGALVQAKEGSFPNVKFDGEGNIFQASKSETEFVAVSPNYTGSPAVRFVSPGADGFLSAANLLGYLWLNATIGDVYIQSQSGNIILDPNGYVKLSSWSKLLNTNSGQNLLTVLNALDTRISNLEDRVSDLEGP